MRKYSTEKVSDMKSYRYKKYITMYTLPQKNNPIFSAYFFNYARYKRGAAYDTGYFHQNVLVKDPDYPSPPEMPCLSASPAFGWRVFGTWVCYFSIPVVQAEFHLLLPRVSECKSMKKKSCFQHSLSFPTPFSDGLGKIQSDVGKGVGKMKGELGNNNRSFANREVKAICFMAKYSPKRLLAITSNDRREW